MLLKKRHEGKITGSRSFNMDVLCGANALMTKQ